MRKLIGSIIFALLLFGTFFVFISVSNERATSREEQKTIEKTVVLQLDDNFTTKRENIEKRGILSVSGLSVAELETQMHTPLSQYAFYFIEAEAQTGVNAVFLASVAALESGWGTSKAAATKNNLFGWTSKSGELMSFESKAQCILYVAENLKEHYLTPDGKYFNGYEVADVNKHYNGREEWAVSVTDIMQQITQNKPIK